MKLLLKSGLILLALVMSSFSTVQANQVEMDELKTNLIKYIPQAAGATIKPTPIKGLYEVMAGSQILYVDKSGRYIIDGDMVDIKTRANLTEDTRGVIRLNVLDSLGEDNMLVYMPEGKVKHTITIFTDIYCPYCRKLHDEMGDYMKNGIKVRYIFVPFKGQESVDTSVSVWCADDKNKAMDLAKSGTSIEAKKCENPISKHQAIASELGIRGAPAIMLESGQLLPGYVPSAKLIEQLNNTL